METVNRMNEKTATPLSGAPGDFYTPQKERFLGFAMGHFTLSLLTILLLWCGGAFLGRSTFTEWANLVGPLLPVAAYFPGGYLVSALCGWSPPETGEAALLAVMLPTAGAWLWVAVILISIGGDLLFALVFGISIFLAAPSSLFVLGMLFSCDWLLFADNGLVALGLCGLLSGLLPPLLFALGSFWQAGRRKKKEERRQNG